MRKPDHFRAFLLRAVPALGNQPDRLHIYVEKGHVRCVQGASLSYRLEYELQVRIEDFAGESDHIIVPMLSWIAEQEPLLMKPEYGGVPMAMDILDNKVADLEFRLPLTERVIVEAQADGSWLVSYPADPQIETAFDGAKPPALLWQLWGTRFAETAAPETDLIVAHKDHQP